MNVLVAGATGVVGRRLVPALVAAGHRVTGTSRSQQGVGTIAKMGGIGVTMDALDEAAVTNVVLDAAPEVVIHQLTAIGSIDLKHLDDGFAATNRLRTDGLDHLLRAAIFGGVQRFIAQSFTGWTNARTGSMAKNEHDPLDSEPVAGSAKTLAAIAYLESTVASAQGIEGVALRYGNLYGPGTSLAKGGEMHNMVKSRKLPIVGGGTGVWSFVHVDDAAGATVQALDTGAQGVYNIVDDEPAPVADWLPYLARSIGAKPPRRVPKWLARPLIGELGIRFMTEIRGASNTKARNELQWQLLYPSWRNGFSNAR